MAFNSILEELTLSERFDFYGIKYNKELYSDFILNLKVWQKVKEKETNFTYYVRNFLVTQNGTINIYLRRCNLAHFICYTAIDFNEKFTMFDWLEEQQEVFTPAQMPDSEYREIPAISGTDVRTFVVEGPKTYNYFKTGLLETEETSALILGTAIHCAILEPEKFAQGYTVYAGAKPNSEQKKQFATLVSEGTDRFKAYSSTYSVAKKSEDKINELANELYTELFGYILHLEKSKGKIALDEETYKTVLNCRDEVKDRITNLFSGPNFKIYTEVPLFGQYKNQKLKGKLDMLVIDYENKEVFIVDVKTTTSYKSGLRSDMLKKRYDLQLDFYEYLVNQQHCFKDFFIRKIIITVQTLGANTSAVIKLITDNNIETILDDIAYRNDTNFWRDYSTLTWEGFNIYDN